MLFFKRKNISTIPTSNPDQNATLPPHPTKKMNKTLALNPSRLKDLILLISLLITTFLIFNPPHAPDNNNAISPSPTHRHHLLFSIASSSRSLPSRASYIRLWYSPGNTRAITFLDAPLPSADISLPPVLVSEDTSRFPYTFKSGLRSAIRVARVVKEAVDRNETGIRWFVFGDDDTVFFVDNLVDVLSKYDHEKWFYIGSNSESYQQNVKYSFDMAFGGGGFAISYSLAQVLARVLDSCLMRYGDLYGSDARIWSCIAELGVVLTHESGFHQVDIRGDFFGMLTAHPLSPLVSLHHLDAMEPIFPSMTKMQGLEHFFKAVTSDSPRILQQTVCYDPSNNLTVSVAWGYAVQIYEGNQRLPDLLSLQKTFTVWKRGSKVENHFMFDSREYPRDPCKRPAVFFLQSAVSLKNGSLTSYSRHRDRECLRSNAIRNLKFVRVSSKKLVIDVEQMKAPRRHCCKVLPSYGVSMIINIRQCGHDELISMPA